jgi:sugar phosphate isomerase/epimerase
MYFITYKVKGECIMNEKTAELKEIIVKFAESGWDLIAIPSKAWLEGTGDKDTLLQAIEEADKECGTCGCEFDPLYKRAIELAALF